MRDQGIKRNEKKITPPSVLPSASSRKGEKKKHREVTIFGGFKKLVRKRERHPPEARKPTVTREVNC